jgi:flagellar L-ring protein precursor FlgH
MSRKLLAVALGLAVFAHAAAAQQPLYDPVTGTSIFSNLKAYDVGDVITIVIRESTVAAANSKTATQFKNETSGGPGEGILGFIDLWRLDFESKYDGNGATERTGTLVSEMTARLIERMPNGQFRIEGTRTVRINGEFETIAVTGVIRARDISSDNKVLSTSIADASIEYQGKGDVGRAGSPGIFTKIVDWLF